MASMICKIKGHRMPALARWNGHKKFSCERCGQAVSNEYIK